jgi:hypothetical protein
MVLIQLSCSNYNNTAIVVINLGLTQQAHHIPFYDKILHFLMSPAYAAAPLNITSISINITAADFSTITKNYSPPFGIFKIEVPSGIQRTIEVLANTPSATLRGVTVVDLEAGEQTVDIYMHLYQTKIIIPDYNNYRLVQIEDMAGSGFISINGSSISFPGGYIYPYDVDFDDVGRIYLANYGFSTGQDVVICLDDITDTSYTALGTGSMNGIKSVAVDRQNNLLYYVTNDKLYRCSLNGTNLKSDFLSTGISNIQGIALYNGKLYIACTYASAYRIVKYNPEGNGQIEGYTSTTFYSAWDVIVKNGQCIVADDDTMTLYDTIVVLNPDNLSYIGSFGTGTNSSSPSAGLFWGPRRFVAILNDKFYLIDEGIVGDNLVSFSNLNFDNWQRYADSFTFFSFC